MRNAYPLFVILMVAFAACSKQDDAAPAADPATQVAGTYVMNTIRYDSGGVSMYNITLPAFAGGDTLSGIITARRDSATVVYTTYTIRQTGEADYSDVFGQLKLQGLVAPYDIYYGTTKVGIADGTTFTIDFSYTDGGTAYRQVFRGTKRQ